MDGVGFLESWNQEVGWGGRQKGKYKAADRHQATGKREFKHPWREAGPINQFVDEVDPDQ